MENQYKDFIVPQAPSRERMSAIMRLVYGKMTLAMIVTGLASMWAVQSDLLWNFLASNRYAFLLLFGVEIGLVIWLSARLNKMSNLMASTLFYVYAAINGIVLAPVFMIYTDASLAKTFFITAGTFGAMSVYGYFTTRDLTSWGTFFLYALFGLIICTFVNMFAHSSLMEIVISAAGVLLFVGLTAYDTWQIRKMAENSPAELASKLSTIGALSLYLDFVNLFLYLLRFFGRRN